MKEFDPAELEKFNGENGNPTYIGHGGKVYDVSASKLWRKGVHMKRHRAGQDLTTDIQAAPHEIDVLERYPQVGTLKKELQEQPMPAVLVWLLKKFPFLRRHPHPMTVHFPIVLAFSPPVFTFIYLITGIPSFEITALHCLAGGILFTIVGIATGLYTWWLNYMARPLTAVKIKLPLTLSLLVTEIVIFTWRTAVPDIIAPVRGAGFVYLILVFALVPMITVIGWYGASMTFPIEKE
jgi:predicted heme/steroid binding protein/uncharacterized membrane protein